MNDNESASERRIHSQDTLVVQLRFPTLSSPPISHRVDEPNHLLVLCHTGTDDHRVAALVDEDGIHLVHHRKVQAAGQGLHEGGGVIVHHCKVQAAGQGVHSRRGRGL